MPALPPLSAGIRYEINGPALVKGLVVLAPFAALTWVSGNPLWMQASILAISTMVVEERLDLTPSGVLLHGGAIIAGIYLLLAQTVAPPFILACMLLAGAVIRIAAEGQKLRPLGNWTFIPALVLANELHGSDSPDAILERAPSFLPYLLAALLPMLCLAMVKQRRARQRAGHVDAGDIGRLTRLQDFGPTEACGESMAAMVVAVGLAAVLVEQFEIAHGQWVVWGAASIVAGSIDTARVTLRRRALGVVIGAPLGIALDWVIAAHSALAVTLATLATLLTLVAFRPYVVGYALRCTFIALAIMLAHQSVELALERLSHVLLGGGVGIACVWLLHLAAAAIAR